MSKIRPKMPIEARAKQFMPFAAVGGLEAALEKKLEEYLAEREPSSTAGAVPLPPEGKA